LSTDKPKLVVVFIPLFPGRTRLGNFERLFVYTAAEDDGVDGVKAIVCAIVEPTILSHQHMLVYLVPKFPG
jgi:hypothetical protein